MRDDVPAVLKRLLEPRRVGVVLRPFSPAGSSESDRRGCKGRRRHARSRLIAVPGRLADELLATASRAHQDRDALRERAALVAFKRTGDRGLREEAFDPDVSFARPPRLRPRPTRIMTGERC